jgi:predicted PurR-regulated permease PerM
LHQSTFTVVGERAKKLIEVAAGTVRSVVYGVIGTAMIQGILLFFGLWLAGVPEPFLLATVTFILGLFPVAGSSLVWIPAGVWLLYGGNLVAGIFLMAYGAVVVGAVDNFLKPYLISRGSKLPFLLVFFGILGGVMTFGILGLFLGPVLLALGLALTREWLEIQAEAASHKAKTDDEGPSLDRGPLVHRDKWEN